MIGGLTQAQYEREYFQAHLTNSPKPYPEIANPTLSRQEREEIRLSHKEQQEHTHERTHAHDRDR